MIKQDWGRLHQGYSHHPWVHWSKAAAGIQSSMSALIKGCNRDAVISHESTDQAGLRMTATGIQLSAEWVDQAGLRKTATGIQLSAEWALINTDFERQQQQRYNYQPRCNRDTVISRVSTGQAGLRKAAEEIQLSAKRTLIKLDCKRLQPGDSDESTDEAGLQKTAAGIQCYQLWIRISENSKLDPDPE